ncbi:MAG: hypothetical protein AAF236_12340 [Verrucomicrobiota bacterium]
MKTQLPGNLVDILPLCFQLREKLSFIREGERIVATRPSDGRRFAMSPWQHYMISRFDGKNTFEQLAREVEQLVPRELTARGLLNFYDWLYRENLILVECESVFELVGDNFEEDKKEIETDRLPFWLRREWRHQALKVAAILLLCVGVLRFAYVVAPAFRGGETNVAGIGESTPDSVTLASGSRTIPMVEDGRLLPAAQAVVEGIPEVPKLEPESAQSEADSLPRPRPSPIEVALGMTDPGRPAVESVPGPEGPLPNATEAPQPPSYEEALLDELRRQLASSLVRRDEFYLQNQEQAYSEEVSKITELARRIGWLESQTKGEDPEPIQ